MEELARAHAASSRCPARQPPHAHLLHAAVQHRPLRLQLLQVPEQLQDQRVQLRPRVLGRHVRPVSPASPVELRAWPTAAIIFRLSNHRQARWFDSQSAGGTRPQGDGPIHGPGRPTAASTLFKRCGSTGTVSRNERPKCICQLRCLPGLTELPDRFWRREHLKNDPNAVAKEGEAVRHHFD